MPPTKKELIEKHEIELGDWKREAGRFKDKWIRAEQEKWEANGKIVMLEHHFKIMLRVNWTMWAILIVIVLALVIKSW